MHYTEIGNYVKAQNMLRVVIYRDIQRVNCTYELAVVFAINERLK